MKKCVLILLLTGACNYRHTKTTDYTYFYDEEKGLKKVEGQFVDGQENGDWVYYSENGDVVQSGTYQFGLPIGNWIYDYPDMDTSLIWKDFFVGNMSFSLPGSSRQIFKVGDTVNKYFSDSSSNTLFAIRIIDDVDSAYLKSFFSNNILDFKKNYNVEYSRSDKITLQEKQQYYIDEFSLTQLSDTTKKVYQILLYKKLDNVDKLIVFGITNRNSDESISKFLIQEVFYHFKLNEKRIVNIYDGFDVR